jgi:biopolymer transport protein ExbD
VVAYGRIMEIMSIINSAGYIKVALITQNLEQ